MDKIRKIIFYKSYFKEFYVTQKKEVRNKINYVLHIIESQRIIPLKFFRLIENTNGIYEIQIEFENNIYRIFCCMDTGQLIVLFQGFQKKSQKTPKNEIKRAMALRKEYIENKNK